MKEYISSPSTSPGFAVVQNEENGFFYFHCNDLNGKSIVQSKDFQTQKLAESGLQNALRAAKHAKNYIRKHEAGQHFFVLQNNNQQKLAKSSLFNTEKELQNAIDYIQQIASASKPASEKEQSPEVGAPAVAKPATKPQAKYSFKIDLYAPDGAGSLSGKIEDLLTQESLKFQGMNESVIASFIRRRLPNNPGIAKPASQPATGQATLQLSATPQGTPVRSIATGNPLLYFQLKPSQLTMPDQEWTLLINARPVGSPTPLVRTEHKTKTTAGGTLPLVLPGDCFPEGLYRLEVAADTLGQRLEAQCMFQVY